MKKTTIIEIITVLFVILFLYTGISKLTDYNVFKEQIATSPLLAPLSKPTAALVPWAEFSVVLLLIIPRWRLEGLYTSLILMILFTSYIIGILTFNEHLPCSCGGVLAELSWTQHLVFNSVFIVLALAGILLEKMIRKESRMERSSIGRNAWGIRRDEDLI
jgi:uncharacterized membrane protein YphA (DoxX/SURF4 family)